MNTLDPMYFGVNIVSSKVVSSVEETTDLSMGEGKIAGTQTAMAIGVEVGKREEKSGGKEGRFYRTVSRVEITDCPD